MVGLEGKYGGCRGGGMSFQLMTAAEACLFSATSHACSSTSYIGIRGHVAIHNLLPILSTEQIGREGNRYLKSTP